MSELLEQLKTELEGVKTSLLAVTEQKSNEIAENIKNQNAADLEALKTALEEKINAIEMKNADTPMEDLPINQQFIKSIQDNEEAIKNSDNSNVRFKAASVVTTANFGTGVILGRREPGVTGAPYRDRVVSLRGNSIVRVMNGGIDSNPLTWVERIPKEGGPGAVDEGNTKPYVDWTYVTNQANESTIAVILPITKQAARNMAVLGESIDGELIEMLEDELNWQVLLGNGAMNTAGTGTNMKGVIEYAKAFTGSSLAGTIEDANVFDVIRAAILQVREGNKAAGYERHTGYKANMVLVSPAILAQMDLTKDKNGVYLLPPFLSANGTVIKGIKVVENEFLDDDDFIVGDFSKSLLNIVEGITIEIGHINDDFAKNRFAIRAEIVGMHRIKAHEAFAFVKGDFTSAKALLEASNTPTT